METILRQVYQDVNDIFNEGIEVSNAYAVPSRDDPGLTFTINETKKGKLIETCVLMADVRNSTKISKSLAKDKGKLGKIYSAFVHAMVTIADEFGFVRNIIGDRVMVVFEPKDCFKNALECAILMNTVSTRILQSRVSIEEFRVGIGVDWGQMLVLKTGIRKRHEEKSEYKNLVWVGDAANVASRLTDLASKESKQEVYLVKHEPLNVVKVLLQNRNSGKGLLGGWSQTKMPDYLPMKETKMTKMEIAKSLAINSSRTGFDLLEGRVHSISKLSDRLDRNPNILITRRVFDGVKGNDPKGSLSRYFKEVKPFAEGIGEKVYGCNAYYPSVDKIVKQ